LLDPYKIKLQNLNRGHLLHVEGLDRGLLIKWGIVVGVEQIEKCYLRDFWLDKGILKRG
jgi:hypothetical protein